MMKKTNIKIIAKDDLKKLPTEFNLDSLKAKQNELNRQPKSK